MESYSTLLEVIVCTSDGKEPYELLFNVVANWLALYYVSSLAAFLSRGDNAREKLEIYDLHAIQV